MKSKVFPKGILNVALAGMLGTMLVMPFATGAQLVQKERLRGVAAPAVVIGSARLVEDSSFSAPAGGGYQANPATAHHKVFFATFPGLGTVLAAAVLVFPFGLSTLRILRRNRVT